MACGDVYHGLSVWEISVVSQSPSRRCTGQLAEAKDHEACDWALNMEAREMKTSQSNKGQLRYLELLQISKR